MDVHFVEATNGPRNHGKFAVCKFDDVEWKQLSQVDGMPLLAARGWTKDHVLVLGLQTGEGAFFFPSGIHPSDLQKHRIWHCPMYPHALGVICDGEHDPMRTEALLDFPDAPFSFAGERQPGPQDPQLDAIRTVLSAFDKFIDEDDLDGLSMAMASLRASVT